MSIGSNIFNVLMILGISAIVAPLQVAQQLIRLDVPIMIGISGLVLLFAIDGTLQSSDGVILVIGSVLYTLFLLYQSRRETDVDVQAEYELEYGNKSTASLAWLYNLGFLAIGAVTLIFGSRLFVNGAVSIAQAIGISQVVIGLTIVAAGTSLPELATSMVATFRGERDIAVGNVIGSNIFNLLTVIGVAALTSGGDLAVPPAVQNFDLPIMVAVAVACIPIFVTGNVISRWEGFLFIGYYAAYATFLILRAGDHEHLEIFSRVMLLFVIPLTIITLLTVMARYWPKRHLTDGTDSKKPSVLPGDTHHR
jgi:cation:H+ antiporter